MTTLLRWYKTHISPLVALVFGFSFGCRFHPTCSEYAHESIVRHGFVGGFLRGAWRVLRCGPWSAGGFDPVA